jgi:cyclopropane fatty-acyl-phospholipid synthase-like methyltransferase|tara:strand:+ start:1433 stop:1651 length:219 start_codon:yes stop_codon:yes gene_type:complete
LDIGCALGRSLVVATEAGFVDLYGVDISDNLISRCRNNIIKVGVSPGLSCIDVAYFEIPAGKLAIYLFNPFG